MKKCVIAILLGLALFISGCSSSADKPSGKETEQKLTEEVNQQITESQKVLQLPAKYSAYKHLEDMDEQFYYLSNSDDNRYWNYIKVLKNDSAQITELSGINKQLDIGLTFAYKGRFFATTLAWGSDQHQCKYQILELKDNGKTSILFSGTSSGLPGLNSCGGYVICQSNQRINKKKHTEKLELLNLKTGKSKLITTSQYQEKEDGYKTGTLITGLEWPRNSPSEEGFCFSMAHLENQKFINGEDAKKGMPADIYYYSIKKDQMTWMGRSSAPADYIGGSEKGFVMSEFANESNTLDHSQNKLYLRKGNTLQEFMIPCDDSFGEIMGSAVLAGNRLLAHSADGFYIFDLDKQTYILKRFAVAADVMEEQELKKLDYQEPVTGYCVHNDTFYFATASKGKVTIHEIQ